MARSEGLGRVHLVRRIERVDHEPAGGGAGFFLRRFSNEVLDEGEKRRWVIAPGTDCRQYPAARVFGRMCEIRRNLTPGPGQDLPKWKLFGNLRNC